MSNPVTALPQWFIGLVLSLEHVEKCGQLVDRKTLNLGMGNLYYGITRIIKPKRVICIGSLRGFAPVIFARAVQDNANNGQVHFIDPGLVDDFWHDPKRVKEHWRHFGVQDIITHHRQTTQEFKNSNHKRGKVPADLVFIDGMHTFEAAKFDHETFSISSGFALFHDSISDQMSTIYKEPYRRTVFEYIDVLRDGNRHDIITFDDYPGLSIVKERK